MGGLNSKLKGKKKKKNKDIGTIYKKLMSPCLEKHSPDI